LKERRDVIEGEERGLEKCKAEKARKDITSTEHSIKELL